MIIEGISVNQGNCPVLLYTADGESFKKVLQIEPMVGLVIADKQVVIKPLWVDKNEEFHLIKDIKIQVSENGLSSGNGSLRIWDNNTSFYDNTHDELKELAKVFFKPVYPVKLPFGEKFAPIIRCDGSKIIEVSLKTNGGEMTFNIGGLR